MATAASDWDQLRQQYEDSLTCPLCLGVFTTPKVLPCSHTYCMKCVDSLIDDDPTAKQFDCPECREAHDKPKGGAKTYKGNPVIHSLLDLMKDVLKSDGKIDSLPCDWCAKENKNAVAVAKCRECGERLCIQCTKTHSKIRALKNHEVIELTGNVVEDVKQELDMLHGRTVYCDYHPNKPLELYCKEHEIALCQLCYAVKHSGHDCEDLDTMGQVFKQELEDTIKTGSLYEAMFEEKLEGIHEYRSDFDAKKDEMTAHLQDLFAEKTAALKKEHERLEAEIAKASAENNKASLAYLGDIEMKKGITTTTIRQFNSMRKHGSAAELANALVRVKKKKVPTATLR